MTKNMSMFFLYFFLSVVHPVLLQDELINEKTSFCVARSQRCTILRGCLYSSSVFNTTFPYGICVEGTVTVMDLLHLNPPEFNFVFDKNELFKNPQFGCTKCSGPCGNYGFEQRKPRVRKPTSTMQFLNSAYFSYTQPASACICLSNGCITAKLCNFGSIGKKRGAPVCVQGSPVTFNFNQSVPELKITFENNFEREKPSGPKNLCRCSVCSFFNECSLYLS